MTRARSIANIGAAVDSGLSWRNRLINGGFQVRQRGSVAASSAIQYGPDRWIGTLSGGTGISATFASSAFGGSLTGSGAFLSGSWTNGLPYFAQRIEAVNVVDMNGGQITVSGKFFQDTGSAQNVVVRISKANAADNWTSSTIVATGSNILIPSGATTPFSATFTLGATDASNGLMVEVYLANAITVTSKNIGIADMQLEAGSVASPFERRDYGRELIMCQRYYTRFTPYIAYQLYGVGSVDATNAAATVAIPLPVAMRASPICSGVTTAIQVGGSVIAQSAPTFTGSSPYILQYSPNSITGTVGQALRLLSNNSLTGYIDASAEL